MNKLLAEILVVAFPAMIFITHKLYLNNKITPYFIPKILKDQKYPKSELRQVGTAYCVLALWIFSLIAIATAFFMSQIEKTPLLFGAFFFVLPITAFLVFVIGITYLVNGTLGRGNAVKPQLESITYVEPEHLPKYIHKLKTYNIVNLSCVLLFIILISVERSLGVAEKGFAILLHISLLIIFVMTLWRIRVYLVKSAEVIDSSGNKYLLSTLSSPASIFLVYINSVVLIWKFKQISKENKRD